MENMEKLKELVFAGAAKRWGEVTPEIAERLNFELSVFERCDAVDYMLMCADVVEAISNAGGYIGPGRGCCVASAVCYSIGVSNVDPIKYELLFERFMRPERIMSPSVCIDTDYLGDRVARELLETKYGAVLEPDKRKEIAWPNNYRVGEYGWIGVTGTPEVERIKETLSLINENREGGFGFDDLADDDWRTLKLFWKGETDGIPYFDSPNMKRVLMKALGPRFRDLVALFALSKPGLADYREKYLSARLQGGRYAHPLLKNVLAETYGVLIYQEQLMLVARLLAGFTRAEADKFRIGFAKRLGDVIEMLEPKFVAGCLANPEFRVGEYVDEKKAAECARALWDEYYHVGAFCWQKAHCVAWTMVSYQLAYLKAHHFSEWTYGMEKTALRGPVMLKDEKNGPLMGLHDIELAIEDGCRVTLLMRHAERPPLDPSDTSFGERLSITDLGWSQARRFGTMLAGVVDPREVSFFASGTFRTIQTARGVGEGLFTEEEEKTAPAVLVREFLGSDSPYFGSAEDRLQLIGRGNYLARLNDYYKTGEQFGYRPLKGATERMLEELRGLHGASNGVVVAVTHDVNVASFLAGVGVYHAYTMELWPYYMDAAVVIESPYGEIKCGVLRWDRSLDGTDIK